LAQEEGEEGMTQTEARAEARQLNDGQLPEGLCAIAHAYPLNSWGGHEKGWTVSIVPIGPFV
jgi:hypothetical protein